MKNVSINGRTVTITDLNNVIYFQADCSIILDNGCVESLEFDSVIVNDEELSENEVATIINYNKD